MTPTTTARVKSLDPWFPPPGMGHSEVSQETEVPKASVTARFPAPTFESQESSWDACCKGATWVQCFMIMCTFDSMCRCEILARSTFHTVAGTFVALRIRAWAVVDHACSGTNVDPKAANMWVGGSQASPSALTKVSYKEAESA